VGLLRAAAELDRLGELETIVADVSVQEDVERAVSAHQRRFGTLDVLVNNAGAAGAGPLSSAPVDQLELQLAANLRTSWLVTAASIPMLTEAGERHGRALVVNLASIAGRYGAGTIPAYSAAKAGVLALSQAAHDELAANGVRVTGLAPAFVATRMTEPLPIDRDTMISPNDIAEAVRFLSRLSASCAVPELMMLRTGDRLGPVAA
jgi:NAD(P)-dependent dehydrogenase (short-subunit alcohol dehydrogenase family)